MLGNRMKDGDVVYIKNNNLEYGLRILKKKIESYGTFQTLKIRKDNPSKLDRRRLKTKRARSRALKMGVKNAQSNRE